jgi:predicted transcriptional regulator
MSRKPALNPTQIKAVRAEVRANPRTKQVDLATKYGVAQATICRILAGTYGDPYGKRRSLPDRIKEAAEQGLGMHLTKGDVRQLVAAMQGATP